MGGWPKVEEGGGRAKSRGGGEEGVREGGGGRVSCVNVQTVFPQVVVHFQGNRARVGPAVYISYLDLCAWFSVVSENGNVNTADFSISSFTSWPVFN